MVWADQMNIVQQMLGTVGLPTLFHNLGEPVEYFAQADQLTHPLTAIVAPAMGMLGEANEEVSQTEEVHVRIGLVAGATVGNLNVGGIPQPLPLDRLVRTTQSDERPYHYGGPVRSDSHTRVLLFRRKRTEQLGTSNQLAR